MKFYFEIQNKFQVSLLPLLNEWLHCKEKQNTCSYFCHKIISSSSEESKKEKKKRREQFSIKNTKQKIAYESEYIILFIEIHSTVGVIILRLVNKFF